MEQWADIIENNPQLIPGLIIGAIIGLVAGWKTAKDDIGRGGAWLQAVTCGVIGAALFGLIFAQF